MAGAVITGENSKKLIRIDVFSDTTWPWCFVGKMNLDKAIAQSKDRFHFQIKWHPFIVHPSLLKDGMDQQMYYNNLFGPQAHNVVEKYRKVLKDYALEYNPSAIIGETLDSHRLIYFAGQQNLDKQHSLVEELFLGYFTQAKYIGDRKFLIECAQRVGIEGAAEFLGNPDNGSCQVQEELKLSEELDIAGVPFFMIDGKHKLSGCVPPDDFLRTFERAERGLKPLPVSPLFDCLLTV